MPGLRGIRRILKKTENNKLSDKTEDSLRSTYLKAMPLNSLTDLDIIKKEVSSGKVLILRVTPLAEVSIEDVKFAVNELCKFTKSIDGDIARLGEERVVICPPNIKIWREKTTISNKAMPTAV
ncbi:MAG: cell division protein SepF [Candidatus Bathyarchaeota archaeon]